jgi:hypothetical protein
VAQDERKGKEGVGGGVKVRDEEEVAVIFLSYS